MPTKPEPHDNVIEFDASKAWTAFGQFIAAIVLMVWLAVWRGFILKTVWLWFVVESFPGTPQISIPAAIGIAAIIHYLTASNPYDKSAKPFWERMFLGGAVAGCIFGLAWIVHLFM